MKDLTQMPNSPAVRPISLALSPELTALLDSDGSRDAILDRLTKRQDLLAEAEASLPGLKRVAMAKAGEAGVKAVIGKRLVLYPQPERSDGEWDAWWADYFDVLADCSLASLEAAMRAYVALPDSEFMPKPGRLRELVFLTPSRSWKRFNLAEQAVQFAAREKILQMPERAPEDVEADPALAEANRLEILRLAKDYQAKTMRDPPKPRPYIGGSVDERGITPQMRALRERQAQQFKSRL